MISNQDLNTLVPASKIWGYLESPQGGLMDIQGSEEIDFENVTNKVTLLSVALTDITRQVEQELRAGASSLNAVTARLANFHTKIGENPLYTPSAAWALRADFILCDAFQFSRHACGAPRSLQGEGRVADFILPRSLSSRRCSRFRPSSWEAASVLGPH
jgi:hypothetical protein